MYAIASLNAAHTTPPTAVAVIASAMSGWKTRTVASGAPMRFGIGSSSAAAATAEVTRGNHSLKRQETPARVFARIVPR